MAFSGTVHFGANPQTGIPWLSVGIDAVAFRIGSLEIRWYGVLIALGMLLALLYAMHYSKSFGVDPDKLVDVAFISIIVGIIGARVYYVVFNYRSEYAGRPFWDVFKINEGGLGIYGGIIFGLTCAYFVCKWRKVKPAAVLDLASIGFLIGQGIGRWGNFTNQEAFGSNTTLPWGMYSTNTARYLQWVQPSLANSGIWVDPTVPVHPCFFYEFLWCAIGFAFLHFFVRKHRRYDGQIFLLYVLWYGLGRFWIEGLRTDSLMLGAFRVSQLLAAVLTVVSAALLIYLKCIRYHAIFGEEGLKAQMAAEAAAKAAKKQPKKVESTEEVSALEAIGVKDAEKSEESAEESQK